MNIRFSKPFPDELAATHLYRNFALNDTSGDRSHTRNNFFAQATRNLSPSDCSHPWTPLYLHQIAAHLSDMTPEAYRADHTMLVLSHHWYHMYQDKVLKSSKVDVYKSNAFCSESPASDYPFKLCEQCREEDLQSHVMTYWHRAHHVAGVDICPKHGIALQQFEWHDAYTSPSPLLLHGQATSDALVQANSHPILTRYREAAIAVLRSSVPVQYTYAHEQLLKRATDMGLCKQELNYTGTRYYLNHNLPRYLYSQLPRVWMGEHFHPEFLNDAFFPPDTSNEEYHVELNRLEHAGGARPLYLLLALATFFDSNEQIQKLLFNEKPTVVANLP